MKWKYFEYKQENVEFRKCGSRIQFRPLYVENPTHTSQVESNAELRYRGASWCDVPSHLMADVPQF